MQYNYLKKTVTALTTSYKAFKPTPNPHLVMTLLVKNEADILENHLRFHKAMGVDAFIVTDNNSTDETINILEKYAAKGWIKEIIHETGINYDQKRWVDKMILLAKNKYKANWVINSDADEFWYTSTGNLKTELKQTRANTLICKAKNVYPEEGTPFYKWKYTVNAMLKTDFGKYDLSHFSLFSPQRGKVIHRTNGYVQISTGNHKVIMLPQRKAVPNIIIYHYSIRGKEHFMQKMINGGKQLEQNPSKHIGRHWRHFFAHYKAGTLTNEYKRVIGDSSYSILKANNHITFDDTIANYFQKYL